MKQHKQANYIYSINNTRGHPVTGFADIANVVTDFYQDLLGVQKEILMEAFQSFSASIGLTVNYNKESCVNPIYPPRDLYFLGKDLCNTSRSDQTAPIYSMRRGMFTKSQWRDQAQKFRNMEQSLHRKISLASGAEKRYAMDSVGAWEISHPHRLVALYGKE
ncbi:hypothetical protein Cgig2_006568 [Carnegiea gigantea]|uniref:Uncharacterized protein n=1 Tax=Carnegiea gigantea TaxID=171969 RepID=A0A9Q1JFQ8_9CARY|nr:hypothetical protein Cgig2_006568 [Carnegiea gigantea]